MKPSNKGKLLLRNPPLFTQVTKATAETNPNISFRQHNEDSAGLKLMSLQTISNNH